MAGQTGAIREPVEHHPANVVARALVLLARVAQAHDDLHQESACLRPMTIAVSPGQSQKRPSGERASSSARASAVNSIEPIAVQVRRGP